MATGSGGWAPSINAAARRRRRWPCGTPAAAATRDARRPDRQAAANDATGCAEPYEVRLRIAARTPDRKAAEAVGAEVRSLHMQGPTGAGGGVNFGARQILAVKSVLIPREWVKPEIVMECSA